jgi:hypothetical protein
LQAEKSQKWHRDDNAAALPPLPPPEEEVVIDIPEGVTDGGGQDGSELDKLPHFGI